MKSVTKILSLLLLVSAALFYSGCGGSHGGTDSPEKVQLGQLSKTWTLTSAKLDATDRTADFSGLKLTMSGTYSKDGGTYIYSFVGSRPNPSPWPASGTWQFGADPKTQIERLDDTPSLAMTYSVTSSQLTINFNYTGAGFAGSRVGQVAGNWTFVFSNP